jgi:hypothetical protein
MMRIALVHMRNMGFHRSGRMIQRHIAIEKNRHQKSRYQSHQQSRFAMGMMGMIES